MWLNGCVLSQVKRSQCCVCGNWTGFTARGAKQTNSTIAALSQSRPMK